MPRKIRELREMLTTKLKASEGKDRKHEFYFVSDHKGLLIARTMFSHGKTEVDNKLQSKIAHELKVTRSELDDLVNSSPLVWGWPVGIATHRAVHHSSPRTWG